MKKIFALLSLLIPMVLVLSGCGGGASSGGAGGGTASTLKGTVAAGAPIIGTVTIKDANGTIRPTPIEANGKYKVDVTGLVAPFKLRAQGHVGSIDVDLYSAAMTADIGGTVNITPFTDLIVAQIAGEVASSYFARADTSKLTQDALDKEKARVSAILKDVLTAAHVDTAIDLFRTSFNADHTGFDQVMDVIKVTVDPSTGAAEIKSILDDSAVSYNVSTPNTTTGTLTAPTDTQLSDIDQITNGMKAFFALFKTSVPAFAQIQALNLYDEAGFKTDGLSLNAWYTQNLIDAVGMEFIGLKIINLTGNDADVELTGKTPTWGEFITIMKFSKASGTWKSLGNQRIASVGIGAAADNGNQNGTTHISTGVNIDIVNPMNEATYAIVTGPGLPSTGVRLENTLYAGDNFQVVTSGGGSDWWPMDDATITSAFATLDAHVPYTFTLYNATGVIATYTEYLSKKPVLKSELQANKANYFAALTTPSTLAALKALITPLSDGAIHNTNVAWTLPQGIGTGEAVIYLNGTNASSRFGKGGAGTSATLALQAKDASGALFAVTSAEFRVHARDIYGREFDTAIQTQIPATIVTNSGAVTAQW